MAAMVSCWQLWRMNQSAVDQDMTYQWSRSVFFQLALLGALVSQERVKPVVHELKSQFQAGATKLRVLLPDLLKKGERCRVLFVLPVEALDEHRYGSGLRTVQAANLHNTHRLICVFPTFSQLPWYVDHPSNPRSRQESYLIQELVPLVDRQYPTMGTAAGRFVLGFSKSGWGAFSLLLRHPKVFSVAGAWDAPLEQARPNQFGMSGLFGTQDNFEKYRITRLLKQRADLLKSQRRLVLTGYFGFRSHHQAVHAAMRKLRIRHTYRDGPKRKHIWSSGWLPELVDLMLRPVPEVGGVEVPEILRRMVAKVGGGAAAKVFESLHPDDDGKLSLAAFTKGAGLADAELSTAVFARLDLDGSKTVEVAEFQSVWAAWKKID
jgi:hypothetical protein